MLLPRPSFDRTKAPSLTLNLLMWIAPSFLNPLRENVVTTIDFALAMVSRPLPSQSVTGSSSRTATSLMTKAVNGLMWILENSIRPFRTFSKDWTTFRAMNV